MTIFRGVNQVECWHLKLWLRRNTPGMSNDTTFQQIKHDQHQRDFFFILLKS
jgi:hypothetical protein